MMTHQPSAPSPYAPPQYQAMAPVQSAYPQAFFDDNDAAIVNEAAQVQLALDEKKEIAGPQQSAAQGFWQAFSGSHQAVKARIYSVRSADGFAWTYFQPYSVSYQMPGEHRFVLRGALPQAIEVNGPHNNWRRPRFLISVYLTSFLLLFAYGAGVLVFLLFAWLFPMRAKYKSSDPLLAKWIKTQPAVTSIVKATKWGWLGLLGSGGWRLPWVIRLTPRGDGTSELVVKSPDIGRHTLTRYRVGFGPALQLARAFQSVLPANGPPAFG